MKKHLIALATLAAIASASCTVRGKTRDISFNYRMGAGFPGDVNRTHPASILPGLMNATNPVRLYGDPVLIGGAGTANSYRGFVAGDTAVTKIDGVLVRPYPTQQVSGGLNAAIGAAAAPVGPAVIDVLEDGFIIVKSNDFAANPPVKNGAVYVWIAASTGVHVQGGFETVASAGNAVLISNARYNGPPDSAGVTEMKVWTA